MKVLSVLFILIFPCVLYSQNTTHAQSTESTKQELNVKSDSLSLEDENDSEQLGINVAGYKIKLKGFFSAASSISNAKDVLSLVAPLTDVITPTYSGIGNKVGFESDSLAGLQLNAPIAENAEVVLQIVARGRPADTSTNKYELNAT
mgnify:CR=1 FL=1